MENDPWSTGRQISVGLKTTAEYDAALLNFKGTPGEIRADLIAFFGIDDAKETDTPYEVFMEAEAKARALANPTTSTKSYGKPGGFKKGDAPKAEAVQVDIRPGGAAKQAEEPTQPEAPVEPEATHEEAVDTAKAELGAETIKEEKADHPHADILAAIEAAENKRELVKLTQNDAFKPFLVKGPQQDPDVAAAFRAKNLGFAK